jgi:hypothetical protein
MTSLSFLIDTDWTIDYFNAVAHVTRRIAGLQISSGAPMPNRPASFATDVRLMSAFVRWKALSQWQYT